MKENKENKNNKTKKNKEVEKLTLQNIELNEKVLRLTAEIQNLIRRHNEEITKYFTYDGEKLIKELLPVVDNFERAINLDDNNLDDELSKFLSGFKLIYAEIKKIFDTYGVVEIECLGKEFDPNTMEAVTTESIVEEEVNIVLDVFQKGYMYKDKLLRPAMVKVNQ